MSRKRGNADRSFTAPDGTRWDVEVTLPSHSSAMVVFKYPDGRSARKDRYNWYQADVPQARNVESRLEPRALLDGITPEALALLFRRSMPVSPGDDPSRALRAHLVAQS